MEHIFRETIKKIEKLYTEFESQNILETFNIKFKAIRKDYGCILYFRLSKLNSQRCVMKCVFKIHSEQELIKSANTLRNIVAMYKA